MSVLPVIGRELRAQARQPLTYWLRIIGGISLACALGFALWKLNTIRNWAAARPWFAPGGIGLGNPYRAFGAALFGELNLFMFGAIWLFVPLAAADAVSRERREGTLVLLYLTELRSLGIVLGKAFVHMLRSLSLFLTMAPWLVLPVLFGGVGLRDIRMALLLNLAAVLLAMAAGLVASTIPRDWLKSVLLAELFAAMLLLAMLHAHGLVLGRAVTAGLPAGVTPGTRGFWNYPISYLQDLFPRSSQRGLVTRNRRLLSLTTDGSFGGSYNGYGTSDDSDWQQIWAGLTPAGQGVWFRGVLAMVLGAGLAFVAAMALGAWRVARSWRDAPQQRPVSELRRTFFAPRFAVPFLARKLSRALTTNPIGWLQIYSPSARLVKWGWCLFIIVVEIILSADADELYEVQSALGLILLLGLAFSATGSFRDELETGAFELLLVTPLRERQIITGRARGLWRQFLPAMLVYGAGSIYLSSGWNDMEHSRRVWLALERTLAGFCAFPLIGLYFSLRRWNFFAAWLAACVVGLLPAAVAHFMRATQLPFSLLQLGIALVCFVLLERRLRARAFLEKGHEGRTGRPRASVLTVDTNAPLVFTPCPANTSAPSSPPRP
jgi:ABC-type transport system involved in multi-copper enzyme maturation permease subunit